MKKLFIALLIIASAVGNVFSQSMSISGGNDHSLFICTKGVLYACGDNSGGRLGLAAPNTSTQIVPSFERVDVTGLSFSQVTAGSGSHNVALACNGLVYCWGSNGDQMACGQPASQKIVTTPTLVEHGEAPGYDEFGNPDPNGKYLGGVKFIAASTSASFAILEDGRAVGWGGNGDHGDGQWIKAPTMTPVFIKDENGVPLEGVTHIAGGDNNCLLLVDPDGDGLGTAYSIGNVNGRGGLVAAKSYFAAPVLKMVDESDPGNSDGGDPLDNIKMLAAGDEAGFAVDGITGYVYGWGTNGGCNRNGMPLMLDYKYAAKMAAGDYQLVSGEAYLTNVIEVIGGNGYGAAITQEGYMLYWGKNNTPATVDWGGVVPDPDFVGTSTTDNTATTIYEGKKIKHKVGPIFAKYEDGSIVKDAVHIARGDLFGFMVNSSDKYYVWGQSNSTAKPNDPVGCMATGQAKDYKNYMYEINTPCAPADPCPTAYMAGPKYKCPGTKLTIYSGFTPSIGKEDVYNYTWYKDGVELDNTIFNKDSLVVDEPGEYKVKIEYSGSNTMCATCEPSIAKVTVIDMEMPIDTFITDTNCVTKDFEKRPTSNDEIRFRAIVNDKFYSSKDKVSFAVFSTATSKDTLPIKLKNGSWVNVYETTGDGGEIEFSVTGDRILDINLEDTIYNIWLEDITKQTSTFFEESVPAVGAEAKSQLSNTQPYYMLLDIYSDITLDSYEFAINVGWNDVSTTITPVIYKETLDDNGNSIAGDRVTSGIPFEVNATGGRQPAIDTIFKANMGGILLEANPARGSRYYIFFEVSKNVNNLYATTSTAPIATPLGGSDVTIKALGIANNKTNFGNPGARFISNLTYSKLTSYNCGRIMLSAHYGCPPCDDPKKLEITASETIKDNVDADYKKVVELCKESDELVLDIEPLEGKNDPTAKFDIFWYDENPLGSPTAKAIKEDETGNATTLEWKTDWATVAGAADIEKAVEKVYYVMVYDHKNPKSCVHYDSIKVIAHPAPIDSLEWMEFCEGSLATEPTFEIADMTINWVDEPTNVVDLTGPATGTGTKEYTYKYKVVDNKTGCESVEHTLTISVDKTGKPDVKEQISLLKDPSVKYNLSAAKDSVDKGCEILWYESETATSEMTNTSIPLDKADTIIVWAEQYNTVTKCTSERVKVEIIINDAPVPEVTNESLCLDNEIPDLSEYVKAKDSDHELNWYDDPAAAKGTGSKTAPSFKATAAGTYKFYVSQTDTVTNAESEKATLEIKVHEVATLDLIKNKTKYCINETAEELTFTANSDGDFTTANWSKKSDMSDATATLTPKTDEKGDVTYYAQAEYTNKDAQKKYASTVCYGKIQDITITTNKTEAPTSNTNFTVQYLKVEGEATGSFKTLLDQDNTAVKAEAGHTLKWYDEDKKPLSAEPSPEYIANETGERKVTYYVSQINSTTGCESELKEVTAIISSFPAPEVKALTFCQESNELKSPYPLTATISTKGGFAAGDYQLIWYKQDPKANPGAEEFITIDLSLEDLSYDATTETEKDFKYWVVQRYNGPGGGQSPAAELLVTIYSKPILKTSEPKPICLGGEVDLKDLYTISNRISNQQYELEYFGTSGDIVKTSKATEHGKYKSRAWFTLSGGEVCASKFEEVFVTVNELEVAIKGDNTTCPGIGVDLTAVLTSKNMDANDVPSYSWNVSPTGVTGQMETLNTSAEGLNKKGDKITVNLEVSMGACKGKKPVDAHIITVDDPGVDGTIKFDEQYNTNSGKGTYTLSKNGIVEFDGCNSKVDVLFNVKQTEEEFTYENLETGEKKTGKFSNGEGHFDIKAGFYEVSYVNGCATSFKFDVKDKSLNIIGSPSSWAVCEGSPLTIKILNDVVYTPFAYDPKKHKIEWQKDGVTLPNYNTEVLNIPSTTPDDNGAYSYTVTSSGCVYHDKIAMGGSFKSKPKVKIDESLLAKDGIYEAVRTTPTEITLPIVQSVGIDMTKLKDKIIWKEEGVEVNIGEKLTIASVDSDHEYNVIIANGDKGSDSEFCGTSLDITLKADALLTIEANLIDAEGKLTKDMCLNEEGVGFKIDTTGTGNILHPDKFTFKIVETIDGVKKDIKLAKKDDYLFAEISPKKSAKYDIVYKYEIGNQDSSKASEITVHPAYEVDWDRDVRLCDGETGFIQITKAEPASEIELTWESDECLINGSKNGANVKAVFSGSGLVTKKAMTLVASNGGICADKKFYPEFTIDKAIEGNIIAPEFVCEGHTTTLDASPFKATEYVWSSTDQLGEGVTLTGPSINVVSKPGYASYIVEMKRGACSQTADATIEVRYAPRFDRIDSLSFRSIEIVLQSNTGTAPFQYIVDDNYDDKIGEPIKDNLEYGNHNVKIIDAAGCLIDSSFVTHAPGLEFPIHISPNGDGINDAFSIPVLRDAYPDANIRIYDRWGKKLADYKAGNAEMDWDGTYNGVQMPSTDYWYEIEIKEIKKTYTGHFTLIRQ